MLIESHALLRICDNRQFRKLLRCLIFLLIKLINLNFQFSHISIIKLETTSVISTNPKLSLSVSSNPTDSKGEDNLESKEHCNEETFLSLLDQEMIKVERFTLSKVTDLRLSLSTLETSLLNNDIELDKESVKLEVSKRIKSKKISCIIMKLISALFLIQFKDRSFCPRLFTLRKICQY